MVVSMSISQLKTKVIKTEPEKLLAHFANNKTLVGLIKDIGPLERKVYADPYHVFLDTIIGQQISNKAKDTIMARLAALCIPLTCETVSQIDLKTLKGLGLSEQKAHAIKSVSTDLALGKISFNFTEETDFITMITSYKGIGIWSAEMMLLFAFECADILSFNDFGIRKGLLGVFEIEKLTKRSFLDYQALMSPFGSQMSLYFWEYANNHRT